MQKQNTIASKSKQFAIKVISFSKFLSIHKNEHIISKQLFRSGTSIGANIRESKNAQSMLDFISKLSIALKEADETAYWLELLVESDIIDQSQFSPIYSELNEIIAMLTSIIKTCKQKIDKNPQQ